MYRASCADCGDVLIRAEESSLHVAGRRKSWRCTFRCPVCRLDRLWSVPVAAGHLLMAGGARVTVEPVPFAGHETSCPPAHRALELDDVIVFHELLSGDGWFDQLVQGRDSHTGHRSC